MLGMTEVRLQAGGKPPSRRPDAWLLVRMIAALAEIALPDAPGAGLDMTQV
jgi:hypothetical protein